MTLRNFILFIFFDVVIQCFGQPEIPAKHLSRTVAFKQNFLYMSTSEVSNAEYKTYLQHLQNSGQKEEYLNALPDTAAWDNIYKGKQSFKQHYFSHPAFMDYPVVNVSQVQAREFCKWKQDSLNKYLKSIGSPIQEIIVRLPTTEEWIMAAKKDLPQCAVFPWEENSIRKESGKMQGALLANIKRVWYSGLDLDTAIQLYVDGLTPVFTYWPNKIGLYNMSGNAAEWVNESGKTKGGSWNQTPYHARLDVVGYFDGDSAANPEIGFRYLVEVVSVKNKKPLDTFKPSRSYFKKNFVPITDKLYAQSTELSNKEYLQFLMENPGKNLEIKNEEWSNYFPYRIYELYGKHEAYYDYPVVNINYEAAVKYCEYLTEKYNKMKGREFKKVKFKLPNERDWELAALGNTKGPYPWGGPYFRNSKGLYLANYSPHEEGLQAMNDTGYFYMYPEGDISRSRDLDGAEIPQQVESIFPNAFGLYNASGNVAEMIEEKGICKGGSWNSTVRNIAIQSKEHYRRPMPEVGVRIFMEILEF